jgi:hypothetical protein
MASDTSQPPAGSAARSVVSLLIVIHFTCVFAVLASNLQRSPLQARLVSLFSVYTQFFAFDPDFMPYYLNSGRQLAEQPLDDDAVLAIDLYADALEPVANQKLLKTVTLPDRGSRWLGDRRRYVTLGKAVAFQAALEADEISGEIAKSVGRRIMLENGAQRAVVRCVRRTSQPLSLAELTAQNLPLDPTAARYESTVYVADVYFDETGGVSVVKRASRGEVAPRQSGSE